MSLEKQELEKSLKNLKKVLDKQNNMMYNQKRR